jgi:hypothetical protein
VLFRHYILEEKYADIAHHLGVNISTVAMQIKRGLSQLKSNLEKKGYVVPASFAIDIASTLNVTYTSCNLQTSSILNSALQSSAAPFKIYSASDKIAINSESNFFSTLKTITFILVLPAIFYFYYAWNNGKDKSISNLGVISNSGSAIKIKKWDFENTKNLSQYQDIGLISGELLFAEKKGINNSTGLLVSSDYMIELDISKYQLPLKLTLSVSFNISNQPGKTGGPFIVKGNYQENQKILYLSTLAKVEIDNPREWIQYTTYITENYIDSWINDQRMHLIWSVSKNNSKIFLRGADKFILDNIVLESIDKHQLPDLVAFEKAAPKINYEARNEAYPLTDEMKDLIPNGKPVLFVFDAKLIKVALGLSENAVYPKLGQSGIVEWKEAIKK